VSEEPRKPASEVIREAREEARLSQSRLAALIGVTSGAISQWENGRAIPRQEVAIKLDRHLGAGGKLLADLGYAVPNPDALVAERMRVLEDRLDGVVRVLEAVQEVLEPELRARGLYRSAAQSSPPSNPDEP